MIKASKGSNYASNETDLRVPESSGVQYASGTVQQLEKTVMMAMKEQNETILARIDQLEARIVKIEIDGRDYVKKEVASGPKVAAEILSKPAKPVKPNIDSYITYDGMPDYSKLKKPESGFSRYYFKCYSGRKERNRLRTSKTLEERKKEARKFVRTFMPDGFFD